MALPTTVEPCSCDYRRRRASTDSGPESKSLADDVTTVRHPAEDGSPFVVSSYAESLEVSRAPATGRILYGGWETKPATETKDGSVDLAGEGPPVLPLVSHSIAPLLVEDFPVANTPSTTSTAVDRATERTVSTSKYTVTFHGVGVMNITWF